MALPDFIFFLITAVVNVYLPLFLQMMGYTATQIGLLLGFFNAVGIVVPLLVTPLVSKSKHLALLLALLGIAMAVSAFPLFHLHVFVLTAIFLSLFSVFYKIAMPVCDSMINEALGTRRDLYGRVRVFGSTSFVIMSLVMQYSIGLRQCSTIEMSLWTAIPPLLFAIAVMLVALFAGLGVPSANEASCTVQEKPEPFLQTIKSFGAEYYLILFVIFMQYLGMVPSNSFFSLYVQNELHSSMSGFLWAFSALCEIPFMFLSNKFLRKYKPRSLILFCTTMVTVRMMMYAFIPNFTGALLGQMMHSVTFGLFYPAAVLYCAQAAKTKRALVTSMSLLTAVNGIANVVGSAVGGVIIDSVGFKILFCLFAGIPFIGITVYAVVALLRRK